MADAPSRSLVIFGDGILSYVSAQHSNLHSLARDGCCGYLALRSPDADTDGNVSALIQLLDLYDSFKEGKNLQTISERFMGMNAAMVSDSDQALDVGRKAGFAVNRLQDFPETMTAKDISSKFLEMVGVGDAAAPNPKPLDLLFVHLSPGNDPAKPSATSTAGWIDSLIGQLKSSQDAKNLLLVLVLGYSNVLPEAKSVQEMDQQLLQLRPRQSYSIKAGKPVENLSNNSSLVAVYHQNAVTRRDHCTSLELDEIRQNCGNLTILADRFLHEVAFKLWKAPKYGA